MARQFTLGKNERLKSRKLIEQLFGEGKSFAISPFKVFYRFISAAANSQLPTFNLQFGVGVSTKNFKKEVDRNRIKRLIKESYRLQKLVLQDKLKDKNKFLTIFLIYTGKDLPQYKDVYGKVSLIFNKLDQITAEIK